jgi:hypothetical protein
VKSARASVPPVEEGLREWYALTPVQRFRESQRLWETFLLLRGSCEPEPDSQSPFYFPASPGEGVADGRAGLHPVRGHEFTRDVDFVVAVGSQNLDRLRAALDELEAEPVFFPLLSAAVLRRGHACHFRSRAAGLHGLRIDVMSKMRGVDSFGKLWKRREEFELPGVGRVAALSLPDLVRAKKTQRDKDWPMIRRLIAADVTRAPLRVPATRCRFWLQECRSYELLRDRARSHPELARRVRRPALRAAITGAAERTPALLRKEEDRERLQDRRYWAPLRSEPERWRRSRPR